MTTTATPASAGPAPPGSGATPPPAGFAGARRAPPLPRLSQVVLAGLLAAEVLVFCAIGHNFRTWGNFFEVLRISVELGLLALALTPVIVTGGIDLSVGSLLGLSAIILGMAWKDWHVPLALAAVLAVACGALGGALNGLIITRLRVPPLIVTLGSYTLFRGLAEGITGGAKNYTQFPEWFKSLGIGHIGPIPAQVPLFVAAAVFFQLLLHRSTVGRALSAIGYSPEGARHAGIPVERRVALTYLLSGLAAAVAAVVYVAHWGQAKADAGTGYELEAITAVVLGGTSIFGGRGTVAGTLTGLFTIAVLKNGLALSQLPPGVVDGVSDFIHRLPAWLSDRLLPDGARIGSSLPNELAAILTGLLLLIATGLDWRPGARAARGAVRARGAVGAPRAGEEELNMRNTQLAVLSAVILAAAVIVAGGNWWLVQSIRRDADARAQGLARVDADGAGPAGPATRSAAAGPAAAPAPSGPRYTIAMMPKSKGNAYFIAVRRGAEEAARQLNVDLIWDGPSDPDPAKQNEIVETWITRGVDVIAVAVENRGGLSSVLRKAREKGIKVVTFDADADPDSRDFFVNQATPEGIGFTLMDDAAQVLGEKGDYAIITATLTASNMIEWQKYIAQRNAAKYPGMTLVKVEPCDDKQEEAFNKATAILSAYPNVKLLMAICSPAVPGAAEAVKQSGRTDVKVIGLGLPNDNKPYVHAGITPDVVLWNTMDLGYLTVRAAHDLKAGTLKPGDKAIEAGRLGRKQIEGDNIILGKPVTFTKENIDPYDF